MVDGGGRANNQFERCIFVFYPHIDKLSCVNVRIEHKNTLTTLSSSIATPKCRGIQNGTGSISKNAYTKCHLFQIDAKQMDL